MKNSKRLEIIDRLGEKIDFGKIGKEKVTVIPLLRIGNILELIYLKTNYQTANENYMKTVQFWKRCGLSRSLQDISEDPTKEADNLFLFLDEIL